MLCSFPALTPKAHTLKEELGNFYIYVHDILDDAGGMDVEAFRLYVYNLAFEWDITLHHSHPRPSLDRMTRVMTGHGKGDSGVSTFVFVFG